MKNTTNNYSVFKTMSRMLLCFHLNHSKYQQYDVQAKISLYLNDIYGSLILNSDLLYLSYSDL